MTGSPVDDTHVEIACPQCAHKNKQPIDWICDHSELACGECGAAITVDRGAFRKAIEDVRQRLNEARSRITSDEARADRRAPASTR